MRTVRPERARAVLTILFACGICTLAFAKDLDAARGHVDWLAGWRRVGVWLRDCTPPDFRIAAAPVGVIGYESHRTIVDVLGLVDREVARDGMTDPLEPPGHQRSNIESILLRRPELVVGNGLVFEHEPRESDAIRRSARRALFRLFAHETFKQGYIYRVGDGGGVFIPVWVRRDRADDLTCDIGDR